MTTAPATTAPASHRKTKPNSFRTNAAVTAINGIVATAVRLPLTAIRATQARNKPRSQTCWKLKIWRER